MENKINSEAIFKAVGGAIPFIMESIFMELKTPEGVTMKIIIEGDDVRLNRVNGDNVKEFVIPDGITVIDDCCFTLASGVTSVTIPNGVTSIGQRSFSYLRRLMEVHFPQTLKKIGEQAFQGCQRLEKVILPDGLTHLGAHAFEDCKELTSIIIPDTVTNVGINCFRRCTSLKEVHASEGSCDWDIAMDGCPFVKSIISTSSGKPFWEIESLESRRPRGTGRHSRSDEDGGIRGLM